MHSKACKKYQAVVGITLSSYDADPQPHLPASRMLHLPGQLFSIICSTDTGSPLYVCSVFFSIPRSALLMVDPSSRRNPKVNQRLGLLDMNLA